MAKRVIAAVVALVLSGAAAATLTGDRLAGADGDRDGAPDAVEWAAGTDPADAGATPAGDAAEAAAGASGGVAPAGRSGADAAAAGAEEGAAAVAGTAAFAAASAADAAADADAAAAAQLRTASEAVEDAAPAAGSTARFTAAAGQVAVALGAASVATGADAAGTGVAAGAGALAATVRAAAAAGADTLRAFDVLADALPVAARAADATAAAAVALAYGSEPTSDVIGDEDGSGVPTQGVWVDVNRDDARAEDGREDVAVTDHDGDAHPSSAERLLGSDPARSRSTPDDLDRDERGATEEAVDGAAAYGAEPEAAPDGASIRVDTSRSMTTVGARAAPDEPDTVAVHADESGERQVLGDARARACADAVAGCAFDPDGDGQTTTNELLLNGHPLDPHNRGGGGPIPPGTVGEQWAARSALALAATAAALEADLARALQLA